MVGGPLPKEAIDRALGRLAWAFRHPKWRPYALTCSIGFVLSIGNFYLLESGSYVFWLWFVVWIVFSQFLSPYRRTTLAIWIGGMISTMLPLIIWTT